ncbi:MAG: IclR family transcriptional regulator [Synergistales bacterium]|nr:IclR family transcriptional regulator [Synergistales bacterium]
MSSIEKGLTIIDRLSTPPYELSLSELSVDLRIGKSGLCKILAELEQKGFVSRHSLSRKYSLGTVFLRMGTLYKSRSGLEDIVEPILGMITEITQESSYFGMKDGYESFLAFKKEGIYNFPYTRTIGKKITINAASTGKVITAFRTDEEIQYLLKTRDLKQWTPNTIIDPVRLFEEYREIRDQGWALNNEEYHLGFMGISVPVFYKKNEIFGCLTVVGAKERFTEEKIRYWCQLMNNGAESVSEEISMRL